MQKPIVMLPTRVLRPVVKTTAAKTAKGDGQQWVPDRTLYNDARFCIGGIRSPMIHLVEQKWAAQSTRCSGPNETGHSLGFCNSNPSTCVA
jgi:hypothetical protein